MDQRINTIITENNRLESNLIHNIDKKTCSSLIKSSQSLILPFNNPLSYFLFQNKNKLFIKKTLKNIWD